MKVVRFLLVRAAKWLGNLSSEDIREVVEAVVAAKSDDSPGWAKAQSVIDWFASRFSDGGGHENWVVRTVVQIVYAVCKIDKMV